jgi:hypothetical protein
MNKRTKGLGTRAKDKKFTIRTGKHLMTSKLFRKIIIEEFLGLKRKR